MKDLKSINRLIDSYARLPSVGKKSAERMAYATLNMDEEAIIYTGESLTLEHSDKTEEKTEEKDKGEKTEEIVFGILLGIVLDLVYSVCLRVISKRHE